MKTPSYYFQLIEKAIAELSLDGNPGELYDPIRYMMELGGKRIRPISLMMANELFEGKESNAISAALGIEVFHNFTLLHDDIMDKAPLRRSKATVHTKWNPDIAILSGDTMFVKSCQLMSEVDQAQLKKVLQLFYQTAIQVCEGQQLDMNFESQANVTIDEYVHMITMKTAVLLGASLGIGAMCANASATDTELLYSFGKNLGIAFQFHDDILDVYADQEKFGKQVGGDIIANKKTFLLLTALQKANPADQKLLQEWMHKKEFDAKEKVEAVTEIFNRNKVKEISENEMEKYFNIAMNQLNLVSVEKERKEMLVELAENLMVREK